MTNFIIVLFLSDAYQLMCKIKMHSLTTTNKGTEIYSKIITQNMKRKQHLREKYIRIQKILSFFEKKS